MFKQYCSTNVQLVEKRLKKFFTKTEDQTGIYAAMEYSLLAGGKRLRPVLLMAAADAVGGHGEDYLELACGLEMIHTYSLIHDDLPAMDNDDYRRGKPTNHKMFGEGMAILAGDGLLTAAFEVMLSQNGVSPERLNWAVLEIAKAAGPAGMVGGQALDLASEGKSIDADTLRTMHEGKTGALFKAALRAGAIAAGCSAEKLTQLTLYGEGLGLAFQITDDILDVAGTQDEIGKPVGSDEKNQKATYVSIYGLEGARIKAQQAVNNAVDALAGFGTEADILRELARYLLTRNN